ncbi:MAG: DUF3369 domain-containing protein [Rhodospirillales bacterium]|nr:DUF3369 domain-containing protein [Rhodospirillales bacterium]
MTDTFEFAAEEDSNSVPAPSKNVWKIAVIDDEEDIHQITEMALSTFRFEGRDLEFIHGYSGAEARAIFRDHKDIAIVLLDVVMEDDHAGLDVVKYIRDDLANKQTRIVLRTGQPGQAPEEEVIQQLDINDYKEKTELTARKLYTLMYASLRSYRDIVALDKSRVGLEKVLNASKNMFVGQFLDEFATGILEQLTSILHIDQSSFIGQIASFAAQEDDEGVKVVAGTGIYENQIGKDISKYLSREMEAKLEATEEGSFYIDDCFLAVDKGSDKKRNVIYIKGIDIKTELERHLINLFSNNVLVAFHNLSLREQVLETQREVVYRLGEAVETRSRETGNHVKRVAEISKLLALEYGMNAHDAEILKNASPLHDLGKIGIPDAVLNKPGRLDGPEWEVMKGHTEIGYKMLRDSKREILKVGAVIANEHHEKWDGSGYPQGISGEGITLEARITAVADVYDALASDRCYKKAWPLDQVYSHFKEQNGQHFEPKLVNLLLENIDRINAIRERYQDLFHEDTD